MDAAERSLIKNRIDHFRSKTSVGTARRTARLEEEKRIKRSTEQLRKINGRVATALETFEEGADIDFGGDFNEVLIDRLLDDFSSTAGTRNMTLSTLEDWFTVTQEADEKEKATQKHNQVDGDEGEGYQNLGPLEQV
eukprot:SAG31_NODE_3276_length_4474_cov_11.371429_3_plen_137_part_00